MSNAYATVSASAGLSKTAFSGALVPVDDTRLFLNDGRMDKQLAFAAGTVVNLDIDFGAAVSLVGWAILNHNLASLDTPRVTIIAANNSGFVGPTTAKTITTLNTAAPRHRDHVFQHSAISFRYWRITFTINASAIIKVGEVLPFAASTVLTRGYNDGSGEPEEFITTGAQMMYGESRAAFLAGPMRNKRLRLQDWTSANNAEILAMWRATKGPVTPLLWIENYEAVTTAAANAQQDCIYGRLALTSFDWSWVSYDLVQPPQLEIRQLGRGVGQ